MADSIEVQANSPEAVRTQIEGTRARMSATIDELEDVLIEKKHRLKEQFDVVARVREKPMHAAGIVFGVGLLLGFLTGGKQRGSEEAEEAERRAALWEARARRLLEIAQEQEEEIEALEDASYAVGEIDDEEWEEDELAGIRPRLAELGASAADRLAALGERAQDRFRGRFRV